MEKSRELFKKISDSKEIFHAKMGTIKDRNGTDLIEEEDINKRWQEYTEELYKKDLHDPDNHDGVIIHLEPDILECEVKWALRSITMNKVNGDDGIPVELFQILENDAVKVLHPICQQIWFSSGHRTGKGQCSFQSQRRTISKHVQATTQLHSFHTLGNVMLKFLQAKLQKYMNRKFPDVQVGLRKHRGTRDQLANICWIIEKARDFQKTSISASLTMPKL